MTYLTQHHGSYWFQLRVPALLVPRYSRVLRINLQTLDRSVAQLQAYQLAGHWLSRFQAERLGFAEPYSLSAPTVTSPVTSVPPAVLTRPIQPAAVDLLTTSYDDLYQAWKRLDPDRDPTILREMRSIAGLLKTFSGKSNPVDLQRVDVALLRDHLGRQRLARGTISKKIGFVSTLLQAGYDAGLLSSNVARGLRIPKTQVLTLVRRSFTTEELERLVTSPIYARRFRPLGGGGEAAAWMPLIALATGARLEEIAQLRIADLVLDPVHGLLMYITDQGEGQQLKTESSRRIIPVHQSLIDAGLLRYVEIVKESDYEWLFPELEPDHDGRRGANFGKWFQRHLRSVRGLCISDPEVVFHSLRHTFKTLCRAARIDEEISDVLSGHAPSSIARSYGEMPRERLVSSIRSLVLPIAFPMVQG